MRCSRTSAGHGSVTASPPIRRWPPPDRGANPRPRRRRRVEQHVGVVEVDVQLGARGEFRQPERRACLAAHRNVAHRRRPLRADPEAAQLVLAPEGAVEEDDLGPPQMVAQGVRQPGDARRVRHPPAGGQVRQDEAHADARGGAGGPAEIARQVPAGLHQTHFHPRGPFAEQQRRVQGELVHADLSIPPQGRQQAQMVVQHPHDRGGRIQRPPRGLAQVQQPQRVVELSVGQDHAADGGRADPRLRMQLLPSRELLRHIGRGVDQVPFLPRRRKCEGALGERWDQAAPGGQAIRAPAVPLGDAAAGGSAQQPYAHR